MAENQISDMPGHLIRRLQQRSTAVFQQRMREAPLAVTSVQYAALDVLADHPGLDQAGLAARIAYDRATIGEVVKRLEQKGLVARQVSKQDRRARTLHLTDAGLATLQVLTPIVTDLQAEILEHLSETERAQFMELARKAVAPDADPD